jgi:chromosome segregation ATPase
VRKISQESIEKLQKRVKELENRINNSESKSNDQLALWREAESSLTTIRTKIDSLQTRNYDLQREIGNYQGLIRTGERELITKNDQIKSLITQLTTAQKQLKDKDVQLILSEKEVKEITELFNSLQIESNNKDNEIKIKEKKIASLRVKLGEAEEDILHRELVSKEKKLDELTRDLTIELGKIKNLRESYEKLIHAREEYNSENVIIAQNDIDTMKQELLQTTISVEKLYKVYRNCEKVAELRIKLEKLHKQKFEAKQEIPLHN